MQTTFADSLREQLDRTWAALRHGIQLCPEAIWAAPTAHVGSPSWLAFHTIVHWERLSGCKRSPSGKGLSDNNLPSKDQALAYLHEVGARVENWLMNREDSQFAKQPKRATVGTTLLSGCLYFLRHNQHHIADLQTILRKHGIAARLWR